MSEPRVIYIKRGYTIETNVYNGQIEAEAFQADLDDCYKAVEYEYYEQLQKDFKKLSNKYNEVHKYNIEKRLKIEEFEQQLTQKDAIIKILTEAVECIAGQGDNHWFLGRVEESPNDDFVGLDEISICVMTLEKVKKHTEISINEDYTENGIKEI